MAGQVIGHLWQRCSIPSWRFAARLSGLACGLLLATFASLHWAELAALRPEDIDLEACTVRISRQLHLAREWHGPAFDLLVA